MKKRALDALMYQEVSKSDLLICRAMGETGWSKTDTSKFMDMYLTNEQNENVNTEIRNLNENHSIFLFFFQKACSKILYILRKFVLYLILYSIPVFFALFIILSFLHDSSNFHFSLFIIFFKCIVIFLRSKKFSCNVIF